jgi:hypothetical protein
MLPLLLNQSDVHNLLQSEQLLAISEHKRCGLILCKEYHAEFAGPGAAISSTVEQDYQMVVAIGAPDLAPIRTQGERQKAYSRRIQWMRWLQRITDYPDAAVRAEKLLAGFEAFFSDQLVATLPDSVLARLIGVFPQTVALVRSQKYPVAASSSAMVPSQVELARLTPLTAERPHLGKIDVA